MTKRCSKPRIRRDFLAGRGTLLALSAFGLASFALSAPGCSDENLGTAVDASVPVQPVDSGPADTGADVALAPSATDRIKNGDETDVDCGGTAAPKCVVGQACADFADCATDSCIDEVCRSASTSDSRKNGTETDVDCGGNAAPKCSMGRACAADADCRSRNCDRGVCSPGAANGKRDGDETDVDCGGVGADACAVGKGCAVDGDCVSASCNIVACVEATHDDGRKNGDETGVDCGGPTAPACGVGQSCAVATDCASVNCTAKTCVSASANNGVKDGDETDVDCGGTSGRTCGDTRICVKDADCTSLVCKPTGPQQTLRCAAPTNSDGRKNGTETDIDCGGQSGKKCPTTKACVVNSDCVSDGCGYDGTCKEASSCTRHFGGDTCGSGEPGDPNARHESCCAEVSIARPATAGGAYKLDKYQVTAGRMRAALERTNGNLRAWVQANRPAWFSADNDAYLPTNWNEAYVLLGSSQVLGTSDGRGCFRNFGGGSTFWKPKAGEDLNGDIVSIHSQDELDPKVLNCVYPAMLAAVCAMDGKRLPTSAELFYAWSGGDTARKWPWGNVGNPPTTRNDWGNIYATHQYNYKIPNRNSPTNEDTAFIPSPGRRPSGNGPFGHSDLVGTLFDYVMSGSYISQSGSFELHVPTGQAGGGFVTKEGATYPGALKLTTRRRYHAFGGRCARN